MYDRIMGIYFFDTAQRAFHRMKLVGKPDSELVWSTSVKSQGQLKKKQGRFCALLKRLAK